MVPPDPALAAAGARLLRACWAVAAVIVLMMIGEPEARAYAAMWAGNLGLLATALVIAIAGRRRTWSMTSLHAAGTAVLTGLGAVTVGAFMHSPHWRFVVMLIVQLVSAALLFLSTRWLIGYLLAATAVSAWLAVEASTPAIATLMAACAVLALMVHLSLRTDRRREDRAHAD